MPNFDFECPQCEVVFERRLSVSSCSDPQTCAECGSPVKKLISMPSFILKGDDWVGKNLRIESQMADRGRKAQARKDQMLREAPGMRLAPNVDGERVGSWSEAQKLAASKGKETSSYEPKIREEKKA